MSEGVLFSAVKGGVLHVRDNTMLTSVAPSCTPLSNFWITTNRPASKSCYRSVSGLTGTGSSRWSGSPVSALAGEVVHRLDPTGSPVWTGYPGRNELPGSHGWLSFLTSLTIVYCRIKELSTEQFWNSDTSTINLRVGSVNSYMNINKYGTTYRNGILLTKFRVSYVKITSTQRNTGRPPFGPHDRLCGEARRFCVTLPPSGSLPSVDLVWRQLPKKVRLNNFFPERLDAWSLSYTSGRCKEWYQAWYVDLIIRIKPFRLVFWSITDSW